MSRNNHAPGEPTDGPEIRPPPAGRSDRGAGHGAGGGSPDRPATGQDDAYVGWVIISYLVAGMVIYGGLGRLVGHWLGAVSAASLIGMLVGLALALALVILRYGRE